MHPYPHSYIATAAGTSAGVVPVGSPGLATLDTTPPPQFGGPEGSWSPETLLAASVADCFILTFRGVTRAAKFSWLRLECRVEAILERVDGVTQFSRFTTEARLAIPAGSDPVKARQLLEKAEHGCLVANSLRGSRSLVASVEVEAAHADQAVA